MFEVMNDGTGSLVNDLNDYATWDEKNIEDKIVKNERKIWGWDSTVSSVKYNPASSHDYPATCSGSTVD